MWKVILSVSLMPTSGHCPREACTHHLQVISFNAFLILTCVISVIHWFNALWQGLGFCSYRCCRTNFSVCNEVNCLSCQIDMYSVNVFHS